MFFVEAKKMVLLIYGIAVKNCTFIFKSAYKEKGAK